MTNHFVLGIFQKVGAVRDVLVKRFFIFDIIALLCSNSFTFSVIIYGSSINIIIMFIDTINTIFYIYLPFLLFISVIMHFLVFAIF